MREETDYIPREAAIETIKRLYPGVPLVKLNLDKWYEKNKAYMECETAIERIQAADVRPVVLCMECKYCRKVDEFEYWCEGFYSPARLTRKDDFCSHGEKREES